MTAEDTTMIRREQLRREIAELQRELEELPPPTSVDGLLEQNRARATAPNALTPKRGTP